MGVEVIAAISAAVVAGVGAIAAGVVSIVKAISDGRKPTKELVQVQKEVKEIKKEVFQLKDSQAEMNKILCRREISSIYYTYNKEKKLPQRDFESTLNIYDVYKSMGGNGAAERMVDEIKSWEVI